MPLIAVMTVEVGDDVTDRQWETFCGKLGDLVLRSRDLQVGYPGKWKVYFFWPKDFTFVCPTELADLGEQYDTLKKLGVEVISVSTDTKFSHLAWRNSERLLQNVKFTMGADPTGKVSRLFGVLDEASGLALRGTFIISPAGKLVSTEINFFNVGRNADELIRKLEANEAKDQAADLSLTSVLDGLSGRTARARVWRGLIEADSAAAAFAGLGYRLVDLQVLRHDELASLAQQNTQREFLLSPRRGDILDAQLTRVTSDFLNAPANSRLEGNKLWVSSIFKWFREDFEQGQRGFHKLEDVFARYAAQLSDDPAVQEQLRAGKLTPEFLDYDWSLNDAAR